MSEVRNLDELTDRKTGNTGSGRHQEFEQIVYTVEEGLDTAFLVETLVTVRTLTPRATETAKAASEKGETPLDAVMTSPHFRDGAGIIDHEAPVLRDRQLLHSLARRALAE